MASWLGLAAALLVRLAAGQPEVWGPCGPVDCLDVRLLWTSRLEGKYLPVTSTGASCDPDASSSCFGGTARRIAYLAQARNASATKNQSLVLMDLGGSTFGGPLNAHPAYTFGEPEALLRNLTPYDVCAFGPRDFMTANNAQTRAEMALNYATHVCPTVLSNARVVGQWEAFGNKTLRYFVKTMLNGWKVGFVGMMPWSEALGYSYGMDTVKIDPRGMLAKITGLHYGILYMGGAALKAQVTALGAVTSRMDPHPADVFTLSTTVSVDTLAAAEELRAAHPDVKALVLLAAGNTREDEVSWMAENGPFDVILRESWPELQASAELVASSVYPGKTVLVAGAETPGGLGSIQARLRLGVGVEKFLFEGNIQLNSSVRAEPAVQATMSALYGVIRKRNTQPYGVISNPLTGGHRGGETPPSANQCYWTDCPAGNTIGRALLWKARSLGYRATVALSNLGGLRAPLTGDANHTVYFSHCRTTQSFQNLLNIYYIIGKDLLTGLKRLVVSLERGFIGAGLRVAFHEPCWDYANHSNYTFIAAGPPGQAAGLARCLADRNLADPSIQVIDIQVQMMDWDKCPNITNCDKFTWQQLQKGTTYTIATTDYLAGLLGGMRPADVNLGTDTQALCDFIAGTSPVQVEPWTAFRDRGSIQYKTPEEGWAAGNRVPSVQVSVPVLDGAPTCPDGMYLPDRADSCMPCPPGTHSTTDASRETCDPCALGFFGNLSGMARCLACPAGLFSNKAASTACDACSAGTFSDIGAIYCNGCRAGSYAAANGSRACSFCAPGHFVETDRATACLPCQPGFVTLYPGSTSAEECICPAGTYRPLELNANCSGVAPESQDVQDPRPPCGPAAAVSLDVCLPCPEGMACDAGSDMRHYMAVREGLGSAAPYPVLLAKFWSAPGQPLSVYLCSNERVCPGGPPGTCANNATIGMSCASCAPRSYKSATGCKPCGGGDFMPMIAVFVGGFLIAGLLAYVALADTESSRLSVLTIALTGGQLVCTVQMMGVFKEFKVLWQEPLATMMDLASLVAFNLRLLKPDCFLGKDSPIFIFLVRLLCLPVLGLLLGLLMTMAAIRKGRLCMDWDRFQNALGLLFVMLYVSITVSMVDPLQCTKHPNGKRAMSSNLAILCWVRGDHAALVAMSIIGFLAYPVAMLSRVACVTLRYPHIVAEGGGSRMLTRFRFLFSRFRPECYYWGFWYLLRNLLLPLIPVIATNAGFWQIFLTGLLLIPFLCFQTTLTPWRTGIANLSEASSLACVLLFVQTASFLTEAHGDADSATVSNLLLGILIAALTSAVLTLTVGTCRALWPGKKYTIFLSHHKEGAASLARWFKMQILASCKVTVFLDSDELDSLDLIVDVVRSCTKHVVLLLTRMTLTRLWCAAEIAAAVASEVHITQVHCCDYKPPNEAFIASLPERWTRLQQHALEQYGITLKHIEKAYDFLGKQGSILKLVRFKAFEEQQEVVLEVLRACGCLFPRVAALKYGHSTSGVGDSWPGGSDTANTSKSTAPLGLKIGSTGTSNARVLILGASSDAEARTTCEVLRILVVKKTGSSVATCHDAHEADLHRAGAEYLLVVLTRGVIYDPAFERASLALLAPAKGPPADVDLVTALADTNFPFPTPDFYTPMEEEGGNQLIFATYLRRVFNILALPFSPHGSMPIMDVQVGGLCRRFRPRVTKGASAPTGTSGWAPKPDAEQMDPEPEPDEMSVRPTHSI